MAEDIISFHIDGKEQLVKASAETTLLEIVREQLGITGVRAGCREGGCGSCSVLIDGELKLSCLTPAQRLQGVQVQTNQGLGTATKLHPIQESFMENGATQCGFCTSGMIMATKALLDENPDPSQEDVLRAISGNVCRCTGYTPIVNAILDAAKRLS